MRVAISKHLMPSSITDSEHAPKIERLFYVQPVFLLRIPFNVFRLLCKV